MPLLLLAPPPLPVSLRPPVATLVVMRLPSRLSRELPRAGGRSVARSSAAAGSSSRFRSRCSDQLQPFRMSSCAASSAARSRGHLWAAYVGGQHCIKTCAINKAGFLPVYTLRKVH